MAKYKMIALDLDGTLLDEERRISAKNKQYIQRAREAGAVVCISTGRGFKSALEHVADLGLDGPFVTANGSEVWFDQQTLLSRHLLTHEQVRKLIEVADSLGIWYWSYTVDGLLSRENFDGKIEKVDWLKLGFYDEDVQKLRAALEIIKDWPGLEISNSHELNIEINPQGISKAVGLQLVCERLGITMDQVVACGDSLNDVEMIKAAGVGVAMGNAQQAVKDIADWVSLSNQEDGVAAAIEKFILSE
jgi:HAD superfamily hydrolase (TIGR01484 family)